MIMRKDIVDTVKKTEGRDGELTCPCDTEWSLEPLTSVPLAKEGGEWCCWSELFSLAAESAMAPRLQ